jgi:hypothetical protein
MDMDMHMNTKYGYGYCMDSLVWFEEEETRSEHLWGGT